MGSFPDRGLGLLPTMRAELRFALLGDPVDHSRSPAIHRAALAELGLSGSYEARRSGGAELLDALAQLRAGDLDGVNVTMPLKEMAAANADLLTELAGRSGSVNTLRSHDGRVEGHTTDAAAARAILESNRLDPAAPILILGAGGAAAAVLIALQHRVVHLAARRDDMARHLAARVGYEVTVMPFGSPVPGAIVVNATPLGMNGESLPSGLLDQASGLIDLAYGPIDPPATVEARRRGLPLVDGVEFLALQAAESFTWWTGIPAPWNVMLEAAKNG